MHTYTHAYTHTYLHTYWLAHNQSVINTYMHTRHTYRCAHIHTSYAYIHTTILPYMHTGTHKHIYMTIHAYIHTYRHTYRYTGRQAGIHTNTHPYRHIRGPILTHKYGYTGGNTAIRAGSRADRWAYIQTDGQLERRTYIHRMADMRIPILAYMHVEFCHHLTERLHAPMPNTYTIDRTAWLPYIWVWCPWYCTYADYIPPRTTNRLHMSHHWYSRV